ncbi:MAG TPA: ATP-dependent zinc metalloprotease FtsH [Acidimicrobiia bacterium]|nr:ATP-dependent zinc metalloprotease FtsH [Acidimicrobiia bacterium]
MTRTFRSILTYGLIVLVMLILLQQWMGGIEQPEEISYSEFWDRLEDGEVATAVLLTKSNVLTGEFVGEVDDTPDYRIDYPPEEEDELSAVLRAKGVDVQIDGEPAGILEILLSFLPWLFLIGFMVFIFMQMQGSGNRVMQFGKSRAKQVTKDMPKVTFQDVAGLDEAIEELEELKEFLQNPDKFRALGAKIPKGVLLFGPPGTGKTLLARAVAGEAGVPFFSISGSDFVEMFVGVGASRVRDLFEQAKAQAPAIVFIDEIDAVGRHRGAGLGGGHDEREQTLNQLLVELDGFDVNSGVIVIAGTNRPDILDPALLRPGRFDRQIVVDRADLAGRKAILAVHARGKPLTKDVDLEVLARQTPGFTGADLANLINEAALLAARRAKKEISMDELEESIERVIAGPERKSRLISEEEKLVIAYHETGHALVGWALPMADPIHKVTIIPRGRSLGHTQALPTEDKYLMRRSELVDQLAMLLGGRTAEELIFVDPTTGAANDIEKATAIARKMVMEYGMSDRLGPMQYGHANGEVFLGRDYGRQQDYSDEVASFIDAEVRKLISQAHEEARQILSTHRDALDRMATVLMERETIDAAEVSAVFADVPKWEHTESGAMRIQIPNGHNGATPDAVVPEGVAAVRESSS